MQINKYFKQKHCFLLPLVVLNTKLSPWTETLEASKTCSNIKKTDQNQFENGIWKPIQIYHL